MGLAYKIAGKSDRALEQFIRVAEMNREFAPEASAHMSKIQNMEVNY
jgi:hypothetical protein